MLIAHHRAAIDHLREPTQQEPWRILVSGCLAGWRCGVDGGELGRINYIETTQVK